MVDSCQSLEDETVNSGNLWAEEVKEDTLEQSIEDLINSIINCTELALDLAKAAEQKAIKILNGD
jgi:hypothetical protein